PFGPTSNKTEIACSNGFCSFFENSNSSDNVYRSCCLSIRLELLLSATHNGASRRRAAIQVRLQSLLLIVDLRSGSLNVLLSGNLPSWENEQDDFVARGGTTKKNYLL